MLVRETSGDEAIREVVLSVHDGAARAHQELYSLKEESYVMSGTDILVSVSSLVEKGFDRLHIAADWENLLRLALWAPACPAIFDVIGLLKKSGATDAELQPFRKSDLNDLLPWLYYGRKFDILRRLCNAAKMKIEAKMNRKGLHIYCHLVSDESQRIIASSL